MDYRTRCHTSPPLDSVLPALEHIIAADHGIRLQELLQERLPAFDAEHYRRTSDLDYWHAIWNLRDIIPDSAGDSEQRTAVAIDGLVGVRGELVRDAILDVYDVLRDERRSPPPSDEHPAIVRATRHAVEHRQRRMRKRRA